MKEKIRLLTLVTLLAFIPTLLVWSPFFFRLPTLWNIPLAKDGMATIVSNYDGPLYLVVAKTLYNTEQIQTLFSFSLPVEYYAAHFPLYPLIIRALSGLTGYPYALLFSTLLSSVFALFFFHKFIRQYVSAGNAIWLTFVFSVFPARWLIVRSVGSPEPLFIGAIIASMYYFKNKKYFGATIFAILAQLTKSPGALLFLAYAVVIITTEFKQFAILGYKKWIKNVQWKVLSIFLIPLSLLGVFVLYSYTFNDFFAYFHSGDNIHLFFPPFQIFNYSAPWVDTHWLEEIIFIYLIGALGLMELIRQKQYEVAWFVGIFFTSVLFVSHRDLMRYSLPIVPFLFAAFSNTLVKKEFKLAFVLLLIPIYLFSLSFISKNVMPISDWSPFL